MEVARGAEWIAVLPRLAAECAEQWDLRLEEPFDAAYSLVVPSGDVGPFEAIPIVDRRYWRESALWWPERRVLVCADALGTVPHYHALGGEPLGVHQLLRPAPPRQLARFAPEHVLCGHGAGVHEDATEAVRDALVHARRRGPRLLFELPAAALRR